ncbi:MAG: LamG domain-containing protein, partial [Planctomycetota bacterium]
SGFLAGTVDDVRMYNRTLSAALVQDLFNGITPAFVKAENPEPADGDLLLDTWVILSWSSGDTAASHDVYLGDNFNDVNEGAGETFRSNQASPSFIAGYPGFPYPEGLASNKIYYWRIDEVEADGSTIHKGDVWTFTTPPAKAYDPDPADSARFVDPNVTISWTAGFDAKLHTLYFGDNFDQVNNATGGLPQVATTFTPGALELDKIYYWRVDEFDGSATRKGDILSFRTRPFIPIVDPNLVGWWKLDGEEFGTVVDYSGYNHHGTLRGDPQWVAGYDGDALEFDGSGDYVNIDGYKGILAANGVQHEFTVAAWIKTIADGEIITWGTNAGTQRMTFRVHGGRIRVEHGNGNMRGETNVNDNEWHHVAAVVPHDGAIKDLTFYLDGNIDEYRTILNPHIKFNLSGTADVSIGRRADNNSRHFKGVIDEARIYDKALAQEEVQLAVRIDLRLAWDPRPANRSTPHVRVATPLSWAPGDKVVQHDVYFGANEEEVTNSDVSDTTGIYRGRQSAAIYTPPETLEFTRRYYWRIDQFNANRTVSKGRVWSFTVANFLLVDDFEGYNDYEPNRIFDKWLDGWGIPTNGSIVGYPRPNFVEGEHYVETEIVHSGSQSMPFFYDNHFKYSEATMTLSYPRDWTERNVNTLTLWFRGDPANTPARMYVVLNGRAVVYNKSRGPTQTDTWTRWNTDLTQFVGVDLVNVNTITIGFGDKDNPRTGGSGVVYFDDIRLYR